MRKLSVAPLPQIRLGTRTRPIWPRPKAKAEWNLSSALCRFLEAAERHQQGNVAVVCHKTVCRLLACHILGVPLIEYRRRITIDNAALNILEAVEGGWRVVTLNDTCHLPLPTAPSIAAEEGE